MKAAAIDIGTNSCRLLIGKSSDNQTIEILKRELRITRLGEGVDQNRKLKETAVDRVYQALKEYKEIIEELQLKKIRVVGTSALRDVKNPELLGLKIASLGFELEIISGEREAELNYLGAILNSESNFLLIDIGGGSTEFIWTEAGQLNFKSLDIGCVRMTERFISDPSSKLKPAELTSLAKYINSLLAANLNLTKDYQLKGVGGTITTCAAIKLAMEDYNSQRLENLSLSLKEVVKISEDLANLDLESRKKIKGLQAKRADIIVSGLIILRSILNYTNSSEIYVSDHDLLYGLLKEELIIE